MTTEPHRRTQHDHRSTHRKQTGATAHLKGSGSSAPAPFKWQTCDSAVATADLAVFAPDSGVTTRRFLRTVRLSQRLGCAYPTACGACSTANVPCRKADTCFPSDFRFIHLVAPPISVVQLRMHADQCLLYNVTRAISFVHCGMIVQIRAFYNGMSLVYNGMCGMIVPPVRVLHVHASLYQ